MVCMHGVPTDRKVVLSTSCMLNPFCVLFSFAVAYRKVEHNRYNVEESRHSRRTFVACLLVSRPRVSIHQSDLIYLKISDSN
jgi:hypothetical protein